MKGLIHSLRFKLIAPFILGALVLTLTLAIYTYRSAIQAVHDATLMISEAKTNATVNAMSLFLRSTLSTVQGMASDPHLTEIFVEHPGQQVLAAAEAWLQMATLNDNFRDLLVLDRNGVCLVSTNAGQVGQSFLDREYVRSALEGRFVFGSIAIGRVTMNLSTILAGPIDRAGEVVGVLLSFNDFRHIVDYRSETDFGQVLTTSFLAPDGRFMAHQHRELVADAGASFEELYRLASYEGERGGTFTYDLRGETRVGYARLEPFSEWVVITSGNETAVYAPANRVGLMVFGISILFLALLTCVVLGITNGVISSLLTLIGYAKRVSEGDVDIVLDRSTRLDELGVLHNALQRMVNASRAMIQKVELASKMKSQFLANMSHEIRTPLNAITSMAHLALRGNLPPKERGYIETMQLAARSLLGVINDILDFSKVEAGMLHVATEPFSLRQTIENTVSIHTRTASEKGLGLLAAFSGPIPAMARGDDLRVSQVMNNLLSNALKFTLKGEVCVHCVGEGQDPQTGLWHVRVSVSDTGIGIAPDSLESLFKPFSQADASITRKFGGTGLGLAISQRLVELMGGRFTVQSAPGEGTTFTFSLNLREILAPEPSSQLTESPEGVLSRHDLSAKRLLIAEDNEINQLIMTELLAPFGMQVKLVVNGLEAVEAVEREDFDLVLMDMQMPVMGGLEATQRIRDSVKGRTLPIVAVTANAMEEEQSLGLAHGLSDYLTKPIDPEDLFAVLVDWLVDGKRHEA